MLLLLFYKEREGCQYEDVTYGAMVRGGYEWNQYIGIEARAMRTFWGEDELGGERLQHVDEYGFSYGIGLEFDLSDKDDDFDEDTYYDREFDGQADQEKGWGLFVDYQRLLVKSGMPDLDVISVGVTYDF